MAVCDFKLFLHDVLPDSPRHANVTVNQVIDMRYRILLFCLCTNHVINRSSCG